MYGATDGVVTTMAIAAGAVGASLSVRVVLILGIANLLADGFSMGASNYLALKSELEQTGASIQTERPLRHGLVTFAAFGVTGAVPLTAFLVPVNRPLLLATLLACVVLGLAGAARSRFVQRHALRCALEMVGIGGIAAGVAYAVGALARHMID